MESGDDGNSVFLSTGKFTEEALGFFAIGPRLTVTLENFGRYVSFRYTLYVLMKKHE